MTGMDLSPARPATTVAEMSVSELSDWVDTAHVPAPAGSGLPRGAARLETIRVLREQSYTVISTPGIGIDAVYAAANAILDTPVDELAAMVVMSDTVMGNWRTIATKVTQVG